MIKLGEAEEDIKGGKDIKERWKECEGKRKKMDGIGLKCGFRREIFLVLKKM